MTNTDPPVNSVDDLIARKTAQAMTLHNLRQAYARVREARKVIENLRALDLPDDIKEELRHLTMRTELSEWRIDEAVREWQVLKP